MNWIIQGLLASLWQVLGFAMILVLVAGALWSCDYLGISSGYGVLAFYVGCIVSANLYFSWKGKKDS